MNVLIADDDPLTLKLVSKIVSNEGFNPILAADGDQAWEIIQSFDSLDMAILDRIMPGLSGLDLCLKMHDTPRDNFIYTIILSSTLEKHHIVEALHLGAFDVLEKPISASLLKSRIRVAGRIVNEKKELFQARKLLKDWADRIHLLSEASSISGSKDSLFESAGTIAAGVASKISQPALLIHENLLVIEEIFGKMKEFCELVNDNNPDKIKFLLEDVPETLSKVWSGVEQINELAVALRKYSGKKSIKELELSGQQSDSPQLISKEIEQAVVTLILEAISSSCHNMEIEREVSSLDVKSEVRRVRRDHQIRGMSKND
jgi:CheY-like chemotaxis protein